MSGRVGGATLTQLMLDVLAARPEAIYTTSTLGPRPSTLDTRPSALGPKPWNFLRTLSLSLSRTLLRTLSPAVALILGLSPSPSLTLSLAFDYPPNLAPSTPSPAPGQVDLSRLREGALPAITVARNLKERHGAVHPTPLQQRLGHSPLDMVEMRRRADPGADVHVELEGGYGFTLGWERYVPGELLFTPNAAGLPTRPLHQLVCL